MKDKENKEIEDERTEEKKLIIKVGDNARRVLKIIRNKGEKNI